MNYFDRDPTPETWPSPKLSISLILTRETNPTETTKIWTKSVIISYFYSKKLQIFSPNTKHTFFLAPEQAREVLSTFLSFTTKLGSFAPIPKANNYNSGLGTINFFAYNRLFFWNLFSRAKFRVVSVSFGGQILSIFSGFKFRLVSDHF